MDAPDGTLLGACCARLHAAFGEQRWWPAETPFEVMVGAILTQNTAWRNVERAIAALRAAGLLSGPAMRAASPEALAEAIRPAGYYRLKARRLHALCAFLADWGVLEAPERLRERAEPAALRQALLGVHGVGEETADSILLYALGIPVFVVDAYTRRIFGRLGALDPQASYAAIQARFHAEIAEETVRYNNYHALIVRLGKEICRPRPRCGICPLRALCPHDGG